MRHATHLRSWKAALAATLVASATVATPIAAGAEAGGFAEPDTFSTTEDASPLFIDVLDNDAAGAVLTSFTPATNGTVALVISDGVTIGYTYKPAADANGTDSFTYTIEVDIDGSTVSETEDVTITVDPAPDAPVANDDVAPAFDADPIEEDGPAVDLTALILANDTDVDGDEFSIVRIDNSATKGTVTLLDGTVTYQATDQAATTDSFGYTIVDSSDTGLEGSGTVTIAIVPNDDLPVGIADEAPVNEGEFVAIPVLDNDEDVDGGDNSIASVSEPTIGTADIDGASVVYTAPDDIAAETDVSFTYQLATGDVLGDIVDVTVTVSPVDDAPVAVDDDAEVDESGFQEIFVLSNDEDVDGGPLEITDVAEPAVGSVAFDAESITYTHEGDSLGDVTFDYTINGGSSATVTVSVLNADDDVPVVDDVALELDEDADPTVVPVLTDGQTDVDGTILEIDGWTAPELGSVELTDGVLTYTPNQDANGPDSFVVTVTDGTNEVDVNVDVSVNPVNDAPVADADDFTQTSMYYDYDAVLVFEDASVALPLLDNDSDVDDDSLSVVIESIDLDPSIGSVAADENGVVFTPAEDWSGYFTFQYAVTDGELESETAEVSVYVIPLSDAPVAMPDSASVAEDGVVYVDVLANDFDVDNGDFAEGLPRLRIELDGPGGLGLEVVEVSQPENGYAVIAGDRIRVEPDPDISGELVIEYRVRSEYEPYWDPYFGSTMVDCSSPYGPYGDIFGPFDSRQARSVLDEYDDDSFCETAIGTLTVVVTPGNDAPVAVNDTADTDEDVAVAIDVLDNDSDIDGDELSIWSAGDGQHGSTEIVDGDIVYTPDENFFGDDAFVYFVTDGELVQLATVEVEVASVNDDPTIADAEFAMDEDDAITFDVVIDDIEDAIGDLSVSLSSDPTSGQAQGPVGEVDIDGTTITYTAPADFFGDVSFELLVEDSDGGFASNTIEISVAPINDVPTVDDVDGDIDEDDSFEFTLDADDVEDGTDLIVEVGDEPADGDIEIEGLDVIYTPSKDWNGQASFTLVVTDTEGGQATANVTIDVAPVNDRPRANDMDISVDEDGEVTFTLDAYDIDGDELTLSLIKPPPLLGDVTFDGLEVTWQPSSNFNGEISWEVEVRETDGLATIAEIFGTVNSVNDVPTIAPASAEVDEDSSVEIEIDAADVDDDPLTITVVDDPAQGDVTINGFTVTYTPEADANGAESFEVQVSDGAGGTASAPVSIDIAPVQDAPTAVECGPYTVEVGQKLTIEAADCGADVDGDTLTINPASVSVSEGSAAVNEGILTFTAPDEPATVSVGFTIEDGNGGQVDASVSVIVEPASNQYIGMAGLEGEVVRVYSAMLGRQPDAGGFAFWVSQRRTGMSFEQMVNHFAASPEFISIFGNRINVATDEEWVDFVYGEIMGRTPDAGGKAFWLEALENGTFSRAAMVIFFSQSPEYRDLTGTN